MYHKGDLVYVDLARARSSLDLPPIGVVLNWFDSNVYESAKAEVLVENVVTCYSVRDLRPVKENHE